jgi:hypothetical protein
MAVYYFDLRDGNELVLDNKESCTACGPRMMRPRGV